MNPRLRHAAAFGLIACATALGLAGTDLVLPAVPSLPAILGGTVQQAQLVLAAFVAGTAVGLLAFGAVGERWLHRRLLIGSLFAYALTSLLCMFSPSLDVMIGLRFLQGAAGSAPAVFAPGIIRTLYGDDRAVAAFGLLGSIEAAVPALAPIAGFALFQGFGWTSSFVVIAFLSASVAVAILIAGSHLPVPAERPRGGSYGALLRRRRFVGQAGSHALTLGALLIVVFAAPTTFANAMGGSVRDFIVMQIGGVSTFMVTANGSARLLPRYGAPILIMTGTVMSAVGASAMLAYALVGGGSIAAVSLMFLLLNGGLGLRGPAGFHAAIVAAGGDDARGAALIVVAILLVTAFGTAAVAPFITYGLVAMATGATLAAWAAVAILSWGEKPGDRATA